MYVCMYTFQAGMCSIEQSNTLRQEQYHLEAVIRSLEEKAEALTEDVRAKTGTVKALKDHCDEAKKFVVGRMYMCICVYVYMCACGYMCVQVHVCACMYASAYMREDMHVWASAWTTTYLYACIHTYISAESGCIIVYMHVRVYLLLICDLILSIHTYMRRYNM
jgi:hypothetical protein